MLTTWQTGFNRWQPPAPAPCWNGTFNGAVPGNRCLWMVNEPGCLSNRPKSEDCLVRLEHSSIAIFSLVKQNLDVYTRFLPNSVKKAALVPVVFWIYGGSLIIGDTEMYARIQSFALAGDVVLVAVNYRLASLGFLAHPALSYADIRGVSGNYGIMDQQLALTWIQQNIADFGGDAGSVTVR